MHKFMNKIKHFAVYEDLESIVHYSIDKVHVQEWRMVIGIY